REPRSIRTTSSDPDRSSTEARGTAGKEPDWPERGRERLVRGYRCWVPEVRRQRTRRRRVGACRERGSEGRSGRVAALLTDRPLRRRLPPRRTSLVGFWRAG